MKTLRTTITIAFALLCCDASATTIQDSLRAAYKYNPELLKSITNVELQKERALVDMSKFLPTIKFETQRTVTKDRNPATKNTASNQNNTSVNNAYQYTHNLFNGGEDYAQLMSNRTLITTKEYISLDVEQKTFLKVIQSHLNIIAYIKIVGEYQKNLNYLEKTLKAEQEKFDVGLTKMTDLATTRASLERGKADLARSIAQLEIEQANYKTLTGIDALALEEPGIDLEVKDSIETIYNKATNTNLALKASKTAYDASEIVSKAAFSIFMPNVDMQIGFSKASNSHSLTNTPYTRTKAATAKISIPIFQGGAEYAQYRTAKLNASQTRLDYIATLADTESSVKKYWFQFGSSKVAFKAYLEASKASKIALEGMSQAYNEGLVSITDLMTSLKDEVNSSISLINAEADMIVNFYQIKTAVGELTAEALGINDDINPKKTKE